MGKRTLCYVLLLALALPRVVSAHAGPPFIVVPEQMLGPYRVVVWADPDVGTGTLLIETSIRNLPPPADTQVTVTTWLSDQPKARSAVMATRQDEGRSATFVANPEFDRAGAWTVHVELAGSAPRQVITFALDVTPPYPTWLESLPCLIPFGTLGVVWWLGMRRASKAQPALDKGDPGTRA